jgi:hypothetical protein
MVRSREDIMFQLLRTLLAKSAGALRGIADLHPAVFSVSDWSASQSSYQTQHRPSVAGMRATELEARHPSASIASRSAPADMRPRSSVDLRLIEHATSKLIVK